MGAQGLSDADYFGLTKSGVDVHLDAKFWKPAPYSSAKIGKSLGFEQIFVPTKALNNPLEENWRGVRVDFPNRLQPNFLSQLCPNNGVKKLPKTRGFECVYQTKSGKKTILVAVMRVTKILRSPASNKKIQFTRYVTLIEQSPVSVQSFSQWIAKTRAQKIASSQKLKFGLC